MNQGRPSRHCEKIDIGKKLASSVCDYGSGGTL